MLMHSHDGLILPADNDPSMNTDELDKGPVYITYTTQSIYVGAHRELDDRTGLTDYQSGCRRRGRASKRTRERQDQSPVDEAAGMIGAGWNSTRTMTTTILRPTTRTRRATFSDKATRCGSRM